MYYFWWTELERGVAEASMYNRDYNLVTKLSEIEWIDYKLYNVTEML